MPVATDHRRAAKYCVDEGTVQVEQAVGVALYLLFDHWMYVDLPRGIFAK